ncbi:hypothetical protein OSB04_030008 [Centaurea solstitialis]|uniref:Cytochrome P450 n=1 Tax=Centaurea solstitialis TaxID=347529 RepID=A0AA38W3E6_9ASTR|nr:hypothetical protein OSB04_030008 [Centaurea solstitialis]
MTELNSQASWFWQVIMISNMIKDHLIPHLLFGTIILLLMILAASWLHHTSSHTEPSLPPGPRSLPIVGYLPFLDPNLHTQFTDMAQTYGPIFTVRVGSMVNIVINTPELAKVVVRDQDETFANRILTVAGSIGSHGGQDIACSNYNANLRNLRKLLVHEALSNKNLKECSGFRRDAVRKMIRNVHGKMGSAIKLNEVVFSTEAEVVTRMMWDNSSNGNDDRVVAELHTLIPEINEILGQPNVSDVFPSLARFDLQGVGRHMKRCITKLERILTSIIDDRIESNFKKREDAVGVKKDFLQILLELKDQKDATSINITQMKALLVDIVIGGTDTTMIVVEWAMTEIMKNDSVMKRVQEELVEVVGLNNNVNESHLPKLEYLEATIKETLRLYPPGPLLIPRSPSQTCTVGGYTIPKGCTIFLNVWSIHRDPRYWDNPLEFNPDRFFKYKGTNKYDFSGNNLKFIPFGSGRRSCPGIPLAMKMQMYILASLLHSFSWSLPKGEEHDLSHKTGIALIKRKPLVVIPSQRLPNASLYM